MEIIIDEFQYPKSRSIFSRLRFFLRILREKSHIFLLFLLFFLLSRRYSHKFRSFLARTPCSPQKKHSFTSISPVSSQFFAKTEHSAEILSFVQRYFKETWDLYGFEAISQEFLDKSPETGNFERFSQETASFLCVSAFCKHIFPLLASVQAVLQRKYLVKFTKKYGNSVISEAENMMTYIIREFFDGLLRNGVKNLVAHTRLAVSRAVFPTNLQENRALLAYLDEILAVSLAICSKNLHLPEDNKRWRGYSLANLHSFPLKSRGFSQKKLTFTDFNVVSTEIHEIEDEDENPKDSRGFSRKSAGFSSQGLTVPKNQLDLLSIFIGDIANHRYFLDQDFIEKYIVTADHNARAERFRSELQEIREETEDSESLLSENRENSKESEDFEELEGEEDDENCENCEKHCENAEEARYYFALILKLFCGEVVDFLESSNLNIYMYYAVKYQLFLVKCRVSQENRHKTREEWLQFLLNCAKLQENDDFPEETAEIVTKTQGNQGELRGNHEKIAENRRKTAKIRELLEKSRTQILQTLVFSEEEYQFLKETQENRDKPAKTRTNIAKVVEFLINFGSSQEND